MRHVILAALCMWSCILTVTPILTKEEVFEVTNYIKEKFFRNMYDQYAYFVVFTENECKEGLKKVIKEALNTENPDYVREDVSSSCIYRGNRMVASSFFEMPDHNVHAEYRLLTSKLRSPIEILLSKVPSPGCAIFYSLKSPCASRCLSSKGRFNILRHLETLKGSIKDSAIVFQDVYHEDRKTDDKEIQQVLESWKSLHNIMPLFRCTEKSCILCFGKDDKNSPCYNTPSNTIVKGASKVIKGEL